MTVETPSRIGVLVAEDSAVTRELVVYLLGQDAGLRVVGTARNGLEAVEQAERLRPDVVLMDVHMPRMNGYEATRRIMEQAPAPIVMMSASLAAGEVAMTFEAISAGALTLVAKPGGPDHPEHAETVRRLLDTVKLVAGVKVIRRFPRRERPAVAAPPAPASDRKVRIIAIGASTGGPQVLAEIFRELPGKLSAPIVAVQHIAAGFTGGLVEWLRQKTELAVKLGEHGESMLPGTVYLAPDGSQMGVTRDGRLRLGTEPAEDGFRPSASYLFDSVAEAYGRSAIGILLTGMGRDGASGLKRLRQSGALTMAQDEESSVVFGMPGEAVKLGAVDYVLPPERIAVTLRAMVGAG